MCNFEMNEGCKSSFDKLYIAASYPSQKKKEIESPGVFMGMCVKQKLNHVVN